MLIQISDIITYISRMLSWISFMLNTKIKQHFKTKLNCTFQYSYWLSWQVNIPILNTALCHHLCHHKAFLRSNSTYVILLIQSARVLSKNSLVLLLLALVSDKNILEETLDLNSAGLPAANLRFDEHNYFCFWLLWKMHFRKNFYEHRLKTKTLLASLRYTVLKIYM